MKIRNGFVSNSSSSSFLVLFEKNKRYTKDKLQKMIFGDKKFFSLYGYEEYNTDTDGMTEKIYKDYKKNFYERNTIQDIDEEITHFIYLINSRNGIHVDDNGGFYSDKDYANLKLKRFSENFSFTEKQFEKFKKNIFEFAEENKKIESLQNYYLTKEYFAFNEKLKIFSKKIFKMIKNNNKDFKLKYFHYSDGDGVQQCCLEQGNIFKNFKHYRFSHH